LALANIVIQVKAEPKAMYNEADPSEFGKMILTVSYSVQGSSDAMIGIP